MSFWIAIWWQESSRTGSANGPMGIHCGEVGRPTSLQPFGQGITALIFEITPGGNRSYLQFSVLSGLFSALWAPFFPQLKPGFGVLPGV
jgi:hypothetical protein